MTGNVVILAAASRHSLSYAAPGLCENVMAVQSDGKSSLFTSCRALRTKSARSSAEGFAANQMQHGFRASQDELGKHHRSYPISVWSSQMATPYTAPRIDEFLRKRLIPVEGP